MTERGSTTKEFKSSGHLQTKRPNVSSVTLGLEGSVDVNEARYWTQKFGLGGKQYGTSKRRYAHPRSVALESSHGSSSIVNQVLFGPPVSSKNPPLAVVCGPRVSLYGTSPTSSFSRAIGRHSSASSLSMTIGADRQVQTGGYLALCGSFRNDGRLMAVGTHAGDLRVCDVTVRATLATFMTTNKLPIRCVHWFRNGQNIFTAGDDGLGRVWDLAANVTGSDKSKPLLTLTGHGDAIRCAVLWQNKSQDDENKWSDLAITGSYDHSIRVWNVQDLQEEEEVHDRCLSVLSHGAPVEALCLMKSDDDDVPVWLLSAGGTSIKVWNPFTGKMVFTTSTLHRKTITSLVAIPRSTHVEDDSKESTLLWRIVTSSLDGLLQFHSWNSITGNLNSLYCTKLQDSITGVTSDETGDRIAIGTTSGKVLFKMRGPSVEQHKRRKEPKAGTYAFFQRGMNATVDVDDYLVTSPKKKRKLQSFDVALRQFRYGDALDDALATRRPRDVMAVLEELGKRRGLTAALANRDEDLLEPILSFTIRYVSQPQFTPMLIGISDKLIDIYGDVAGESEMIDELFAKLKTQVGNECNTQKSLLRLVGQIDAVMAASERDS